MAAPVSSTPVSSHDRREFNWTQRFEPTTVPITVEPSPDPELDRTRCRKDQHIERSGSRCCLLVRRSRGCPLFVVAWCQCHRLKNRGALASNVAHTISLTCHWGLGWCQRAFRADRFRPRLQRARLRADMDLSSVHTPARQRKNQWLAGGHPHQSMIKSFGIGTLR
jgi:hypothetical protein